MPLMKMKGTGNLEAKTLLWKYKQHDIVFWFEGHLLTKSENWPQRMGG
jgi:hypothetical protein